MNNYGKTMDSTHLTLGLKSPSKEKQKNDDLLMNIDNLSPITKENINFMIKSISTGEARVVDRRGKPHIEYAGVSRCNWDGSNANTLAVPKSDSDLHIKIEACLELVEFMKTHKPPSGVVRDTSFISLSPNKRYRELNEFEKMNQVLGKGNSSLGDIIVLKDIKTGKELAQKTIMISEFRCDEVRCWVALNETGYVPHIYMFRIVDNKVEIHMEILEHAKTLSSIIDDHMTTIRQPENRHLVKPFSLYVLDGAIQAISCMHKHDFTHNDMHSGNGMLDSELKVKIIDFGTACSIRDRDGVTQTCNVKKDIGNVLRIFSGLYTTQEYTSVLDMQKTYHEIKQTEGYMGLSEADRSELFNLIDVALTITHPNDLVWYRMMVKESLEKALPDSKLTADQLRKDVVALLFPETQPFPSPNLGQVGSTNKVIKSSLKQLDDDKADVAGGLTALSNSELRADPLREKAAALQFPETSQTVHMNQDTAGVADGSTAAGAADSRIEELRKRLSVACTKIPERCITEHNMKFN